MNTRPTPACKREDDQLEPPWEFIARVIEQQDRLAELHNKNADHFNELLELCGTLRKERDRLAEALDLCLARLEHHTEFGALVQSDMSAMHSAREALQSLTTNEKP